MTLERPMFPPVDPSRRGFLAQAAAVAAGGAAVGMALPLPVSVGDSGRVPDPILGLIEAHKAASAAVRAAVHRHSVFEKELQANRRLQQERRTEDDVRRWEEIEAAIEQAFDAQTDAACALVSENPTTMAGVLALLAYANAADEDGEVWPDLNEDVNDGSRPKTRSWHFFLIESLNEVLPKLAVSA